MAPKRGLHRGIAQLVEYRSPKPWVAGSNPPAPVKNALKSVDFSAFFVIDLCDLSQWKVGGIGAKAAFAAGGTAKNIVPYLWFIPSTMANAGVIPASTVSHRSFSMASAVNFSTPLLEQ